MLGHLAGGQVGLIRADVAHRDIGLATHQVAQRVRRDNLICRAGASARIRAMIGGRSSEA